MINSAQTSWIGVYVCRCGSSIAEKVCVEDVAAFCRNLPSVALVREYAYLCSDPGRELIRRDIAEGTLNRIVVAACSPLLHEKTFRKAAADAGLNPFLVQIANIREHVAWVTESREQATEKAKAHLAAAVRRVTAHESLEQQYVPVHPCVLVVGGGVAGIHAALTLAHAGKKVVLVARESTPDGTLRAHASKMTRVKNHPNITLMSDSEVESIAGSVGNYQATIRRPAGRIEQIEIGAIIVAGGSAAFDLSPGASGGVFLAGACQGRKGISQTVARAEAAATEAMALIDAGRIALEPGAAWIDEGACSGCKTCISLCPYSAVTRDEQRGIAMVDETLCKGCGTCAAACPTGAAQQPLFTTEQVYDEIEGIMQYV